MASRSLRILGSGTFWTSSEVLPIQQLARIGSSPRIRRLGGEKVAVPSADGRVRLRRVLGRLPEGLRAFRAALGSGDLPGFQDLLQPTEIVADLLVGFLA